MAPQVHTVAFEGVETRPVEVQVQMSSGLPAFSVVGLADKAVVESRERVRAALSAIGIGLPPKRITVNLAPANLPKSGSHFDLPIALGLLVAMDVIAPQIVADYVVLGELALDGRIAAVSGVLPAALAASANARGLICPSACGAEAAWSGLTSPSGGGIVAPASLIQMVNHFKGTQVLSEPEPGVPGALAPLPDMADVRGQQIARRALEVAAAGGHHVLMMGPPGAGKSMLAQRLPSLLPPLSLAEMLEVSVISSMAGTLVNGALQRVRPFRAPHHSASMAALVGGGGDARPGEVSLAHRGVLFLDELAEFPRRVLDALRQPVETGDVTISRVQARATYPARFQLVAAMNPCRCGFAADPAQACSRRPQCMRDYLARISGPLLDRFDIRLDVSALSFADITSQAAGEDSAAIALRVARARAVQAERYGADPAPGVIAGAEGLLNAQASSAQLDTHARPDAPGRDLLARAVERMGLTGRGYHRVLRVARTVADLDGSDAMGLVHLSEALSYRAGAGLFPGRG